MVNVLGEWSLRYAWVIPLLPIVAALALGALTRYVPRRAAGLLACAVVLAAFAMSLGAAFALSGMTPDGEGMRRYFSEGFTWIQAGALRVRFAAMIDPLSVVMMLVVTGIGFLIHVYSLGYMAHDEGYKRFFVYLNLFTGSMLMLVTAGSLLVMFVGWELVGLCSYLLIGFWYHKDTAAAAGKKAFIVNRVGDFGFLLGILMIFGIFGSLDYSVIFGAIEHNTMVAPWFANGEMRVSEALGASFTAIGLPVAAVAGLCLFLGAAGKSAQIPLYVWLPDAMEGPTPVSALIHAATMVTAGVYMVARMSVFFAQSAFVLSVIACVGAATALFAATIGLVQTDIKKVLAYSTVSQLGYMFLACGVGAFSAGVFHLVTHAFFKALLFLAAGSVIHAMEHAFHSAGIHKDPQDMRNMGGLANSLKVTAMTFWIGALAISGIPGLSGFFSKDEILWKAYSSELGGGQLGLYLWIAGMAAALMTSFYIFRLIFLTFHGESRSGLSSVQQPRESPRTMTFVLSALAVGAVLIGYIGVPHVLHWVPGNDAFYSWLAPVFAPAEHLLGMSHGATTPIEAHAEKLLMMLSIMVAVLGLTIAAVMYLLAPDSHHAVRRRLAALHEVLYHKYYVDEIYSFLIVRPGHFVAEKILWKFFDVKIVDGAVNGAGWLAGALGEVARRVQTGVVINYAFVIVLGVIALLIYVIR